mgnify:CR=1 FL=1
MSEYDCTADVMEHKRKVEYWARDFVHWLEGRIRQHDNSKLMPPEKAVFDEYTPKLKELVFGSDEYKAALVGMGEGLKHHYEINRHHPEHYENGINGMTLVDLVEMFCDWLAAAEKAQRPIDIDYVTKRFNLSPQLVDILVNTMRETDFWCEVNGVPVVYFTPESLRGKA